MNELSKEEIAFLIKLVQWWLANDLSSETHSKELNTIIEKLNKF